MMARLVLAGVDRGDRQVAEGFACRCVVLRVGAAQQHVEIARAEAAAFGGAHADTFMMGVRGWFAGGEVLSAGGVPFVAGPSLRAGAGPIRRIISPARPR